MHSFKFFVVLTVFLTSCAELNKTLESDWSENMKGIAGTYNTLIPFIYDNKKFESPTYRDRISELIGHIAEDSKNLNSQHKKRMLGDDPLFKLTLIELKQTSLEAKNSFLNKEYEHSKYLLKNSILFCAQCHIHSNRGPEILEWDNFADFSSVPPLEQSKIYAATRQYSKAESVLSDHLTSSPLPADDEFIKTLKYFINLIAKQKKQPEVAITKIERIKKNRHYSLLLPKTRLLIENWKSYLTTWVANKKMGKLPKLKTLVSSSDSGRFMDDIGFVTAVRNSLIYHDSLKKGSKYKHKPVIYYKLGILYDRYPEMSLWGLPESYFQACIFLSPHSEISRKCYKDLEKRIHNVYRFNGPASIPLHAREKLLHYKSMSTKDPKHGAPRANFYDN